MSAAKHTPGPWRVETDIIKGNSGGIDVMSGDLDSGDLRCVASDLNSETDARLIAVAPELLAALKELCLQIRTGREIDTMQAQAVIAKAEPTPDTFTDSDRMHDQAADVAAENEEFE